MARKRTDSPTAAAPVQPDQPVARSKPLVFISHDTRDAEVAEAFGNLLTDASGGVLQSFRSSDRKGTSGIEFGTEWYSAIMERLDSATDVVALLTEFSIDRPWILYEAGVAKGKLDRTVFGLAIGIPLSQASVGPFAQFQNSGDDEDSLTKLVLQLIRRNPDANPREEAVRRQVVVFRDATKAIVDGRRKSTDVKPPAETGEGSVAKLFEEVKAMVGQLPERLEGTVSSHLRKNAGHRRRRFHPALFEEIIFGSRELEPREQATMVLMAASVFRDELPWLYDILSELHHAVLRGDRRTCENLLRTFVRLTDSRQLHYIMDRTVDGESDRVAYMMIRYVPELIEHLIARMPPRFGAGRKVEGQTSLIDDDKTIESTPVSGRRTSG